jgi:lipopolysaccharide export system permease protein
VAYRDLINTFKVDLANAQLPEQRFIKDFDGYIFYIGKNHKQHLEDVRVFFISGKTNVTRFIRAETGEFQYNAVSNELNIQLFDTKSMDYASKTHATANAEYDLPPLKLSQKTNKKPSISSMTYLQLVDELHNVETTLSLPPDLKGKTADELRDMKKDFAKHKADAALPIRVQMHRQVAFSFACFGFTLIGIPLGIRMHRRETNVGTAMALLLVMVYYAFIIIGQVFDNRPELAPQLIVWLPNFVFQATGAVLLWRANRGI